MWKGTTPNLNAKPETINPRPKAMTKWFTRGSATVLKISIKSKEPVTPYSMDIPYSRKPEARAPRMKYLIPASTLFSLVWRIATKAYIGKAMSSRPR